jgi:hypothetical protein
VGVGSVVAVQSLGAFNVGAAKWFAHTSCGEIVNPNNNVDATVDPIKIINSRKELKILLPFDEPDGLFNYFPS